MSQVVSLSTTVQINNPGPILHVNASTVLDLWQWFQWDCVLAAINLNTSLWSMLWIDLQMDNAEHCLYIKVIQLSTQLPSPATVSSPVATSPAFQYPDAWATSQFWLLTVLFSKTIGLIVNSQFLVSHFWKLYQHFVSLLTDSLYRKIFFLAAFHCIKNCLIVNSLCTGKYFYNTFYILFYILLWKESSLKLNITNIQWL